MNIQQMSDLLNQIQARNNMPVGDSVVLAWHQDIGDLDYAMAVEAARLHFRTATTPWIMPGVIRAGVERILLAGLGARQDEYGNEIETDGPALAAWLRLQQQKGISA